MSFLETFILEISSSWTGATLSFAQPSGPQKPYIVILIVPPTSETPLVFEEEEGEGGELQLQFSCAADSPQEALSELEALKTVVRAVRGLIGTAPQYRVSANRCSGVQSFDASLGTWQAIFEATVQWSET
jgi:hypothetical protein